MYHELQRGDLCRLHAINNLLGFEYLKEDEFNMLCDKFDKLVRSERCSRIVFYNVGGIFNILGYCIFRRFNITMTHHGIGEDRNISVSKDKKKETLGYFVYSHSHIWVVKRVNDTLYLIDSMSPFINAVGIDYLNSTRYGVIEVFTVPT